MRIWRRSKRHSLEEEVANLVKEVQASNDALENLAEKLEANIKRNEAEIRGLELQLSKKHEFIERLFASMLERQMTAPTIVKAPEKKESTNMIDISTLDAPAQDYVKKKLAEKTNGAKKLP